MKTHLIQIIYTANAELPMENEIVLIDAPTLQDARNRAMRHNTITAAGRFVKFLDENGNEIIGSSI
jgi:hypothetical protein